MNDFIAINQNKYNNYIIKNNGFFPDINLTDLRACQNLDGTVTDTKLKNCAVTAIGRVNLDLASYQINKQRLGINSLVDVKADAIDGISYLVQLYLQAVYCHTQALLIERYANFDATAKQIDKNETVETLASQLYRESRYAIRDILGTTRSTIILV